MTPLTPAPGIQRVSAYSPPRAACQIDLSGTEAGMVSKLLREPLDANVLSSAAAYPNTRALASMISATSGADEVLITAGADDAIDRACRAMLSVGRSAIVTDPTFEMIPRYVALTGAELRATAWPSGALPADDIIALADETTSLVAIVSPNNPTGAVASLEDIRRVHDALPSALILLDLAYVEFADDDITAAALALPRIVVTRTLSKAWGLPGLRVGYAIGAPEVIGWMRRAGGPYSVSALSLSIAQRALTECVAEKDAHVSVVRRNRARLTDILTALGVPPLPSQANFVTITGDVVRSLHDALAASGIATRQLVSGGIARLRITIPANDVVFERLVCALRVAMTPSVEVTA